MSTTSRVLRKRACAECRQQKLRCDLVSGHQSGTCGRCRRLGIECGISTNLQWTSRKSKPEMQKEINALRRRLEATISERANSTIVEPYLTSPTRPEPQPDLTVPTTAQSDETSYVTPSTITTTRRSLDGLVLEPVKIDACISRYFQHYHQYLPILDPSFSPDQYYEYSPLLFWVLITTGSRRYSDDPTLLGTLGPKTRTLALQSLANIPQYIQIIQGLLILCFWPVPFETIFKDLSLVFSGAAMQLALQHGLHLADARPTLEMDELRAEQDYEGARIRIMRANTGNLWIWCKIVCHSISIANGLDPYTPLDAHGFGNRVLSTSHALHPVAKIHGLTSIAVQTLSRHAISEDDSSSVQLSYLVGVFDRQFTALASEYDQNAEIDSVRVCVCRLHILCFHFFSKVDEGYYSRLLDLYHHACSLLAAVEQEDSKNDFVLYSSQITYRAIVLSGFVIIRILRSQLAELADYVTGERYLFSAINMLKRRSLGFNDIDSRNVTILGLLWRSKTAFRRADGSYDGLTVRNRSRGSYSIVFDCYWYWIQELRAQSAHSSTTNAAIPRRPSDGFNTLDATVSTSATSYWSYETESMFDEAAFAAFFGVSDCGRMWDPGDDIGAA